jgi:membrane protease YdiL (CAAX protease family)
VEHAVLRRIGAVFSYLALTYLVSWTGALAVAAPYLLRGGPIPKFTGLMMFPVMLLGPSLVGLGLTWKAGGAAAFRELRSRMGRLRVPIRWYATLLIPPVLIAVVLLGLEAAVAPAFAPNSFFIGFSFGIAAGFFEEIGWMGYAFPRMSAGRNPLAAGALLGLLWGLWHLPVIDFLGAASPHGDYLLPYFAAFVAAMTAMRVIIAWVYSHLESVALSQLMHAISTGSLVALGPFGVTPGQETLWYAVYAAALWIVVAAIACTRKTKGATS